MTKENEALLNEIMKSISEVDEALLAAMNFQEKKQKIPAVTEDDRKENEIYSALSIIKTHLDELNKKFSNPSEIKQGDFPEITNKIGLFQDFAHAHRAHVSPPIRNLCVRLQTLCGLLLLGVGIALIATGVGTLPGAILIGVGGAAVIPLFSNLAWNPVKTMKGLFSSTIPPEVDKAALNVVEKMNALQDSVTKLANALSQPDPKKAAGVSAASQYIEEVPSAPSPPPSPSGSPKSY